MNKADSYVFPNLNQYVEVPSFYKTNKRFVCFSMGMPYHFGFSVLDDQGTIGVFIVQY